MISKYFLRFILNTYDLALPFPMLTPRELDKVSVKRISDMNRAGLGSLREGTLREVT